MKKSARAGLRHPLFPDLATVLARDAGERSIAIAGTYDELSQAGAAGARASRAIFPLQSLAKPVMDDCDRDALWELFQVPVYALVVDEAGRIVAFECEAQEGLHVQEAIGLSGKVETSPCDCGWPGLRWIPAGAERRCA